ncbi:DUF58 domain-containing protein [Thalassotalea litorea]|uniref:DUF58 domain-containing protein n=1 Tax=Thalassotalea litorea TaxID=2020715 RepID=A0A5R9IMT1_9GAMM|nr:DUF58 domain-containing protein [Thalassotalea litorea]TLU61299.1 DUF58 domain-containing protein [Thalassotalea litorea]
MSHFLDPQTLAELGDLPLIAKRLATGYLQGEHASVLRGNGIEFNQYRAYEPGDDLAKLDWKLFARSDKYFVRQAERESDIKIHFIVDASASMSMTGPVEKTANSRFATAATQPSKPFQTGLSKHLYAKFLTATLAYLAHQQGDSIALSVCNSEQQRHTGMANTQRHLQRVLIALEQSQCAGHLPLQWHHDSGAIIGANMIIVITDFAQQNNEIIEFIESLVGRHREVVVFQLQSQAESEFDYQGLIRFVDPETGRDKVLNGDQVKQQYLSNRRAYLKQVQTRLLNAGVSFQACFIEQPLDHSLRQFLTNRMKMR